MNSNPSSGNDSGGAAGRPQGKRVSLASARIISLCMYGATVTYAYIGSVTHLPPVSGIPDSLPWLLLGVAVIEYPVSLFLERLMLSEKRFRKYEGAPAGTAEGAAVAAAIVVSAYGVSFAVYGLVLALLSFAVWPWWFYGFAALHGIHLHLRWDRYEEADRRARTHLD